jgi:hypothetical protein
MMLGSRRGSQERIGGGGGSGGAPRVLMSQNVIGIVKDYLHRIVSYASPIKALLLDHETATIAGLVLPQSVLNDKEVFLTRYIDAKPDPKHDTTHMKALIFVRPTEANIQAIANLISKPDFSEVYLCKLHVHVFTPDLLSP